MVQVSGGARASPALSCVRQWYVLIIYLYEKTKLLWCESIEDLSFGKLNPKQVS